MRSLAQARSGAQAAEGLEHPEAAQMAPKARRAARHWPAQKGGVLYASEARDIAGVRVEDEFANSKQL